MNKLVAILFAKYTHKFVSLEHYSTVPYIIAPILKKLVPKLPFKELTMQLSLILIRLESLMLKSISEHRLYCEHA